VTGLFEATASAFTWN